MNQPPPERPSHSGTIYTIGHSHHPIARFLTLLETVGITCVVDVRSTPFSRYNPQYNREVLQATLREQGVAYLHFGREFGARHNRPELLDRQSGRVDFEKVRQSSDFQQGVRRLEEGVAKGFRIALMCAEADPFFCHRFGMISGDLAGRGWQVLHILKDGSLLSNAELEKRLLQTYAAASQPDLFGPAPDDAGRLARAYRMHNRAIGYRPSRRGTTTT